MLIQGTNAPIIIEFDDVITDIIDISVILAKDNKVLKKWGKADVRLEGTNCYCPLEQEDTINLPVGSATLEVKWTNDKGEVNFAETALVKIEKRVDSTILVEALY